MCSHLLQSCLLHCRPHCNALPHDRHVKLKRESRRWRQGQSCVPASRLGQHLMIQIGYYSHMHRDTLSYETDAHTAVDACHKTASIVGAAPPARCTVNSMQALAINPSMQPNLPAATAANVGETTCNETAATAAAAAAAAAVDLASCSRRAKQQQRLIQPQPLSRPLGTRPAAAACCVPARC